MKVNKLLEQFILFDKKKLLNEMDEIKQALNISKEFKVPISEMSSIYLRNLSFDATSEEMKKQIKENKEKDLDLYCTHNGKAIYLKGFGKVGNVNKDKMENIFKLITLVKILKSIDEVSYFSSQYYRTNKQFDELFEDTEL